MKPRLIILSDLWGNQKAHWVEAYIQGLKQYFEIQLYDCCELGDIDFSNCTEEALHKQFIQGGIERAVQKLGLLEKEQVAILAFSMGGTIAWKYALASSKVEKLYCVSSTRLRYEADKPKAAVQLWFGERDAYTPSSKWFDAMQVPYEIVEDQGHELYKEMEFIQMLTKEIRNDVRNSN